MQQAAELGYAALAITDRNSLAGVVRAHVAAKAVGLKLLIGAEIWPSDGPPLLLWSMNRAGYGRLSRLITVGRRRAEKGACLLSFADVAEHGEGLMCGILPHASKAFDIDIAQIHEAFGDRCYLLAELHHGSDDARELAERQALSRQTGIPLAAANGVHYHVAERQALQDVLRAVDEGMTVAEAAQAGRLFPNAQRCLQPVGSLCEQFAKCPEALARTIEIADRCQFSLDELRYEYPEELVPAGLTPSEFLSQSVWQGAADRFPAGVPDKVRKMIEHELQLIALLRYEPYFLTVSDLVRFARSRHILCQGRGSAANSVVCYCLGVTSVDPDKIDLFFERFISQERDEAPDIDIDFEHERREEVLQYLYEKFGRERTGMTAEVITYRPRSAVRDIGKALGLSLDAVDRLAKSLDGYGYHDPFKKQDNPAEPADPFDRCCQEAGLNAQSPLVQRLKDLVIELLGFPRHLSQHVGGMVMTQGPLCELVPIENAAMPGRTVIQWDKDDLDALGMLKVDCLCLGMLTAIRKGFDLLEQHDLWRPVGYRRLPPGSPPTDPNWFLAAVPPEDTEVYDMICQADTLGVFQIESRAQMSMLPRLLPRCFYDLVIEVAIVRPGPIQGNMVHPYLRRRAGLEAVTFPNEKVREVLHKTLGVPIFQEQAMRLAVVAAGFSPSEADQLRRAMGAWRKTGVMERFKQKFLAGMDANGYTVEYAEQAFKQISGFGEYGFPESHSASFALLVYVSAWMKRYHPAVFAAALLNSQPMGFYAPAQIVRSLREHGGEVRPVDVNFSQWDCTLERDAQNQPVLRLGLRMVKGLPEAEGQIIARERDTPASQLGNSSTVAAPYSSLTDFAKRTELGKGTLTRLARGDAFGSLDLDRRSALWDTLAATEHAGDERKVSGSRKSRRPQPVSRQLRLFQEQDETEVAPELPALSLPEQVLADYRTLSLSLRGHPMSMIREELDRRRVSRAGDLPTIAHGRYLRVAGVVLVRQRPGTARGITFVTLEDETGTANLIVRPEIMDRYRRAARNAAALIAHGSLERHGQIIHVMVNRLEDVSDLLRHLPSQSRDFR